MINKITETLLLLTLSLNLIAMEDPNWGRSSTSNTPSTASAVRFTSFVPNFAPNLDDYFQSQRRTLNDQFLQSQTVDQLLEIFNRTLLHYRTIQPKDEVGLQLFANKVYRHIKYDLFPIFLNQLAVLPIYNMEDVQLILNLTQPHINYFSPAPDNYLNLENYFQRRLAAQQVTSLPPIAPSTTTCPSKREAPPGQFKFTNPFNPTKRRRRAQPSAQRDEFLEKIQELKNVKINNDLNSVLSSYISKIEDYFNTNRSSQGEAALYIGTLWKVYKKITMSEWLTGRDALQEAIKNSMLTIILKVNNVQTTISQKEKIALIGELSIPIDTKMALWDLVKQSSQ